MNQLHALYRLQQLESSIDAAKKRADEIEVALENDETVQRFKTEFETCETQLRQAEGRVKDLELDVASLISRTTNNEQLLYSGKIGNPKELQERQEEITSLGRRRATRESELLDARLTLKETQKRYTEAKTALEAARKTHEQNSQEMLREQKKLRRDMSGWLQDRKGVLEHIDPDKYKVYKKIKVQKNGLAVARLNGESCEVCRVEQYLNIISQVRQHNQLVFCHNCGRILVDM